MTVDDRKTIYMALAAPFPEEAIERSDGRVTGKGYSTTGIKYQYVVNRLNDVLGLGGFRVNRITTVRESTTSKGRTVFEATCEVRILLGEWREGSFVPFAEAIADGGHTATAEADARKGAFTNGFKKAAAFFGVGRQAYEGTLDDDSLPAEDLAKTTDQRRVETSAVGKTPRVPSARREPENSAILLMTETQRRTLFRLATQRGVASDFIAGWLMVQLRVDNLKTVTADQAGQLIRELQSTNGAGPHAAVRRG
jgi:hypothetical protein